MISYIISMMVSVQHQFLAQCSRINDNNFSGAIPDFIQNWKQLTRLEMHGSGLEGPIPSNISLLNQLTELVLRNCNISGEIPKYIWKMMNLQMLWIL
ncbi:probable LRR receptor-like serine/threonine-protein kinase At1g07650 isoform X2 [Camellia sinensis]|uniref:probable LRR receptor-like serine/threonine-protein kinase At1g07650 isoform X2 n=1 Tax=Camellia sinensis TaxID=4442 RepID=UPI0010367890|nr:probable LRR receptor-like serine/threonine-protein kinase At1g07650 isoform X2 [Camellia sinensis]